MCFGTLQIAAGLGGTLLNAMAQNEQANQINAAYQQNAINANAAADEQYAANYTKQIQEEAAAVQERMQSRVETLRNKGSALASAQNGGSSLWSVLNDIQRQGSQDVNAIDVSLKNKISDIRNQTTSIGSANQQRIDSMPTATGADPFATALSGLGVVLGAQANATPLSTDIGNSAAAKAAASNSK